MRHFLRDWLRSRLALQEFARLAAAAVAFAVYWPIADHRGLLWLGPRIALITLIAWLALEPILYFVGLPLSCLADVVRRRFEKEPGGPYCPKCGYDIRATLHFCPECGTELRWGELPR